MDSFFAELLKLGAAGLVIYVIAAPLIKYLIDRSREQDKYLQRLVNDHLRNDSEKHQKIISSLDKVEKSIARIPEISLAQIAKTYPPTGYQKTSEAAERILSGGSRTVVNVNPSVPQPVSAQ